MSLLKDVTLKNLANSIKNGAADLLSNSDFISRTIGMTNSYEDIMFIVQALGREPVSLLGKDYAFIFDHVRRNFLQGTYVTSKDYDGCSKFTFYKEAPTVRFADPYNDPMNLLDRWKPNMKFETTKSESTNKFYAESNDEYTNNKSINNATSNMGVATGQYSTSFQNLRTCDLIKKTNDNFNHGKYQTLVARFHTNIEESKDLENPTQTAVSKKYGMSHGRNLLKMVPDEPNGYDNPYCRVWTYHHQYNQIARAIRPFADGNGDVVTSAKDLEMLELGSDFGNGGFRTIESKNYGFKGGSERLDEHGVLNYENGFVNIAPTAKIKDYFEGKEDDRDRKAISTKRCMFSIENLAWKDTKSIKSEFDSHGLSPEQKGPLGGRIMWFPPYDLKFNEDVSVNWNNNQFIGRGEGVHTYTNTERRGNLSFTLIIDHPSILDYWTGHERNGMKNKGQTLLPNNTDGVDGKDNQENTLLRFFAGCDILTAKPQKYKMRNIPPQNKKEEKEEEKPLVETPEVVKENPSKSIYCFAFYPNNYSGKDDLQSEKVDPIHYLLNGFGTQIGHSGEDTFVDMSEPLYASFNYATDEATKWERYGGYEMRSGKGISITKEILTNDTDIIQTTESVPNEEFITKGDGIQEDGSGVLTIYYGEPPSGDAYLDIVDALKQIGSKALSMKNAKGKAIKEYPYEWYRRRWYYRVDKDTENQQLMSRESYLDTKSYCYNSTGIYNCPFIQSEFDLTLDETNDTIVSLTDMYIALKGDKNSKMVLREGKPHPEGEIIYDNPLYDEEKVAIIKDVIENKERYKITNITYYGHASVQGNNKNKDTNKKRNNSLAKNRAHTLSSWLHSNGLPRIGDDKYLEIDSVQKNGDKYDVNDPITKFWRSAYVKIDYEEVSVSDASSAEPLKGNDRDKNGEIVPTVQKTSIPNKEQSSGYLDFVKNIGSITGTNGKPLAETAFGHLKNTNREEWERQWIAQGLKDGKNYLDVNSWDYDDKVLKQGITLTEDTVKRYDNEGEFFEVLDKEAPFLHHLITEKIKYFDPAYHAISPEGFNSRLTFLHQCTRQGSTVENSAYDSSTAYNLAFGRPPVCVLRIGDFYYTKIIINSLSIQYDQPQWDLNPEGIGVMPMFANISINFTFLGGSDLGGPIARLQNAVSFNYYANASVYDNRAEMVEYDPDGSGKEVKFKGFVYPSIYGKKNPTVELSGQTYNVQREGNREGF